MGTRTRNQLQIQFEPTTKTHANTKKKTLLLNKERKKLKNDYFFLNSYPCCGKLAPTGPLAVATALPKIRGEKTIISG